MEFFPINPTPDDCHLPPGDDFTFDQAHKIMQEHFVCDAIRCPRRRAAQDLLVAAGRCKVATPRRAGPRQPQTART